MTEGFWGDKLYSTMEKLKIDKKKCIGCGLCASIAGGVFRLGEDGKAEVIGDFRDIGEIGKKIQEAIDSCPVSVISFSDDKK